MGRNLVIARVGRNSLHPSWIDRGAPRDWDLHLAPYQPIPAQDGIECTVGEVVTGPKWTGVRELLNTWDGWRDYDYIWLPDDDIYADQRTISAMFDLARRLGLHLFTPALHESSYYTHYSQMANRRFFARRVGFVEIIVPGFSRTALERFLPTLDLGTTGWGWGLDSVWPKMLDYRDIGVIDAVTVLHTRPVGRMRDAALGRRLVEESDRLLEMYDCRQMHVIYGAVGPDLAPLDWTPERLLAEAVAGWRYLWERDPRVLTWIAEFQREAFPPPDYPIPGTPDAVPGLPISVAP
jgi:hypothetical protein